HKHDEGLTGDWPVAHSETRKRDQRQVHRVQHQLDTHQHADRVAFAQRDAKAQRKKDCADREEVLDADAHASASSASSWGVRASMIEPTSAAVRSTDAISKGN